MLGSGRIRLLHTVAGLCRSPPVASDNVQLSQRALAQEQGLEPPRRLMSQPRRHPRVAAASPTEHGEGHADLAITSRYLRGIDNTEIIAAVHERPAPMVPPDHACRVATEPAGRRTDTDQPDACGRASSAPTHFSSTGLNLQGRRAKRACRSRLSPVGLLSERPARASLRRDHCQQVLRQLPRCDSLLYACAVSLDTAWSDWWQRGSWPRVRRSPRRACIRRTRASMTSGRPSERGRWTTWPSTWIVTPNAPASLSTTGALAHTSSR